jgi:hypothetical protein
MLWIIDLNTGLATPGCARRCPSGIEGRYAALKATAAASRRRRGSLRNRPRRFLT